MKHRFAHRAHQWVVATYLALALALGLVSQLLAEHRQDVETPQLSVSASVPPYASDEG